MDTKITSTEPDLLHDAIAATQFPGLEWTVAEQAQGVAERRADAFVSLRFDNREATYRAELKRGLRRATLGATLHHLAQYGDRALLVADYITPQMADELRSREVQFIDTAGNAFLNQPPLYVWVKGQRPRQTDVTRARAGRAFQAGGLQVIFTLLCKPETANLPYRKIAELAGVAHGTVGWVMGELPTLGFIAKFRHKRRLVDAERLLKQWVISYAQTLRPKLLLGRYESESTGLGWVRDLDVRRYQLLLGGEPAAARITGNLRPGTATFYAGKFSKQILIDHHLMPDKKGNIEVLRRFWTFDGETSGMVPHVLVYADLLAIGDGRCLEAAGDMYAGIVAGFD